MTLNNLKIGVRLALGFGALCAFLLFIIAFGINMLGRVNEGTEQIVQDRMPKIEMTSDLMTELNDVAIALRNMMLNEDKADRQKQLAEIDSSRRAMKERLTNIMAEITAASREQTDGIEQIHQAITQMDDVTQQNAALVEQAAAAAESLQEQAVQLTETVSIFRIEKLLESRSSAVAEAATLAGSRTPVLPAKKSPTVQHIPAQHAALAATNDSTEWNEF